LTYVKDISEDKAGSFLPGRGTGYCFRAISFFLCFFVSNIARKRLDRLAWNFQERCGVTIGHLIKFWVNSGKWVGGSKVNLFVITGHSSQDWR